MGGSGGGGGDYRGGGGGGGEPPKQDCGSLRFTTTLEQPIGVPEHRRGTVLELLRAQDDGRPVIAAVDDDGTVTTDFPKATIHDLRHTAASLAISAGANVKAVQTMLGHQSAALTLDTYADLFPDDLERVADALDAARGVALGSTADALRTGTANAD